MKLPDQLQKATPAIAGSVVLFGISTLFATSEVSGLALFTTGLLGLQSENAVKGVASTFSMLVEVTGGKLGEYLNTVYDRLCAGSEKDLEKVLTKAIKQTVQELHEEMLIYYKDSSDEALSAVSSLFVNMERVDYKALNLTETDINSFALKSYDLLGHLLANPYEKWSEMYEKENALPEDFELNIASRFAVLFSIKFKMILKEDDNKKACIEYFLLLLETNALINRDNAEKLAQVSELVNLIKNQNDYLLHHTKDIVRISELMIELLPALGRQLIDTKNEMIEQLKRQNQPSLFIPERNRYSTTKIDFRYKAQTTAFVSREAEIEQLRHFALNKPEKKLCWWMITGLGGIGKSRTAFELCLQLEHWGFCAGFLDKYSLGNSQLWTQWEPLRPTLLIIDYASTHIDQIIDVIKTLEHQQNSFKSPVRVLLIDREFRRDIWDKLKIDIEVESTCFNSDLSPLILFPFDNEARWAIIEDIHRQKNKKVAYNKKELLQSLQEIDQFNRPLFTFLAAVALVEGDDIRGWNKNDLLERIMMREEIRIWKKSDYDIFNFNKHKNFLALCTLARGLSSKQVEHLKTKQYSWLPLSGNEEIDNTLYSNMANISYNEDMFIYWGFEPDILGEYFVLRHLTKLTEANNLTVVKAILSELWNLKPFELGFMVAMILQDFSDYNLHLAPQRAIHNLLINATPDSEANINSWMSWGRLRDILCNHNYSAQIDKDTKHKLFEELYSKALQFDNDIFSVWPCRIIYNFVLYYAERRDYKACKDYLSIITFFSNKYSKNEFIVASQSAVVERLISMHIENDEPLKAQKNYELLKQNANNFLTNKVFQIVQADGCTGLIYCHCRNANKFPNDDWMYFYSDLIELSNLNYTNILFALAFAKGTGILVEAFAKTANFEISEKLLKNIEEVCKHFKDDISLLKFHHLSAVSSLVEASFMYKRPVDIIVGYYDKAEDIFNLYPIDEIILTFCKLNASLLKNGLFINNNLDGAFKIRLVRNLRSMQNIYKNNRELQPYFFILDSYKEIA